MANKDFNNVDNNNMDVILQKIVSYFESYGINF